MGYSMTKRKALIKHIDRMLSRKGYSISEIKEIRKNIMANIFEHLLNEVTMTAPGDGYSSAEAFSDKIPLKKKKKKEANEEEKQIFRKSLLQKIIGESAPLKETNQQYNGENYLFDDEMEIADENKPMSINENKIEASTSRTNIKQMIMSTDSLPVSNMYNTGLGHIQEALPENPYQGL